MFQEIFKHQPASLFFWPMLAMVLFVTAFTVVLVRVAFTSMRELDADAAQPLRDEDKS